MKLKCCLCLVLITAVVKLTPPCTGNSSHRSYQSLPIDHYWKGGGGGGLGLFQIIARDSCPLVNCPFLSFSLRKEHKPNAIFHQFFFIFVSPKVRRVWLSKLNISSNISFKFAGLEKAKFFYSLSNSNTQVVAEGPCEFDFWTYGSFRKVPQDFPGN